MPATTRKCASSSGVDLLVIDDFALQPLDMLETANICRLSVERHHAKATVGTSNRDPSEWLATMADPLLAQSAVDRLPSPAWVPVHRRRVLSPAREANPRNGPVRAARISPVAARHALDTGGHLRDHRHSRSKRTRRGPMLLAKRWSFKTGKRHQ